MEKNKVQKVLFLTNIPSPYRVAFFKELGKKCNLTVLYEKESASDRNPGWKNEEKERNYREIFLNAVFHQADNGFCPGVCKFLKSDIYDIIVVGVYSTPTGMYAIQYMKKRKMAYYISCDGGMIKEDNIFKYKLKKYFLSGAKGYLSPSESSDSYLIYYGAEKDRIYRYPFTSVQKSSIRKKPVSRNDKNRYREELNISEKFVVLTVGQFIHRKGHDILLKAVNEIVKRKCHGNCEKKELMNQIGIYIIGDKPTEEYLELQRQGALENVHFIDFQGEKELRKYYLAADIFVLATREDIWGLVINEAMAAGLPVITTDKCVAGLELVGKNIPASERNGIIVRSEDVTELADAIVTYWEMPEEILYKESQNSLKKIEKYSIEEMAEAYIKVLERA